MRGSRSTIQRDDRAAANVGESIYRFGSLVSQKEKGAGSLFQKRLPTAFTRAPPFARVDFFQTTMGLRQLVKLLPAAFQIVGNRPCFGHAGGYSRFPKKRKSVFDGAKKYPKKFPAHHRRASCA